MIPETMRACQVFEYGDPSVLTMVEVPVPPVAPDGVLIRVRATSVAPHDVSRRADKASTPDGRLMPLPFQPGQNAAGEVAAVGDRVEAIAIGDHVATMSSPACGQCWYCRRNEENYCERIERPSRNTQGTCAEYIACRESEVLVAPKEIPFEKLGICVWAYATAWNMAVDHAEIEPGYAVLVTGAAGSIGLAAIQIARLQGASRVIGTAGSPGKADRLKALGCDEVILYRDEKLSEGAKRLTGGRGVDLVLDCVGGDMFVEGLRALRIGGTIVNIARLGGGKISFDLGELFPRGITIRGTRSSTRNAQHYAIQMLADGRIEPTIHAVLPLDQVAEGHRMFEAGDVVGRIVLTP